MSYILAAWIASISFAMVGVIGKLTSKYQVANPWLFTFIWHLFILFLTIPIALYNGASMPSLWTNILIASVFYAIFDVIYVIVLSMLDVSVMMPLFNFRTVISAILSALFLQEFYSQPEYLLIGVIVIAGFFVTMDEKFSFKSFFQKGSMFMVSGMLVLSLMSIFINEAVKDVGLWTALLWIYSLGQLWMCIIIPKFAKDMKKLKPSHIGSLFLMAVAAVVGFLAEAFAISQNITISTVIISLPISMLIVIALSFVIPQLLEKHSLKVYAVRFVATAVMIGATLKLAL